jgi:cell shape-determining protein MreC
MIGFWNAIIVLTLVLTAGGLVKSWMKHRLELKRLELEQTRQENQRLRSQLELWQRQLAGRVETLETIATGADDELKQKLLALSAPSGAPPHSTDNG